MRALEDEPDHPEAWFWQVQARIYLYLCQMYGDAEVDQSACIEATRPTSKAPSQNAMPRSFSSGKDAITEAKASGPSKYTNVIKRISHVNSDRHHEYGLAKSRLEKEDQKRRELALINRQLEQLEALTRRNNCLYQNKHIREYLKLKSQNESSREPAKQTDDSLVSDIQTQRETIKGNIEDIRREINAVLSEQGDTLTDEEIIDFLTQ